MRARVEIVGGDAASAISSPPIEDGEATL